MGTLSWFEWLLMGLGMVTFMALVLLTLYFIINLIVGVVRSAPMTHDEREEVREFLRRYRGEFM